MGREMSMEPYPNRQFRFIDNPHLQSDSGWFPSRTRTRGDGPDPLLTLLLPHRDHVQKISVNGASNTFGPASWKMQGLCGIINPKSNYPLPLYAKIVWKTVLLSSEYQCQWSGRDFGPCVWENPIAERRHWAVILISAVLLSKKLWENIATMP